MLQNLRTRLALVGVRQGDFAALVGVSRVTVGKWCSGRTKPSRHVAEKAAAVLSRLELLYTQDRLPGRPLPPEKRIEELRALVRVKN